MAVPRPPIHNLTIEGPFSTLSVKEKRYAHHMARAAWHGSRIILRQVSPESDDVFDFIIELYRSCSGDWDALVAEGSISQGECDALLDYAATFLSNIGNYYGSGDQKFVPSVSSAALEHLSKRSSRLEALYNSIHDAISTVPPYGLGFPSDKAQSASPAVSCLLEEHSILPENTRLRKRVNAGKLTFEVLQASVEHNAAYVELDLPHLGAVAMKYTANENQALFLSQYIASFKSGDLETYRDSQRTWVKDKTPRVENILGFVEPYRDPYGIRAEFEGLVAITDLEETRMLMKLVENSSIFIKRLPWAGGSENDGKGPYEKALFEPPGFTSIHTLAYCSSIIFPGINLPNYNDIREQCGFKNVIIANRMSAESNKAHCNPFVDPADLNSFQKAKYPAYYWWVVLHELLGHGTGRMMVETSPGNFNFDKDRPPINPLSGEPITTWYKPGQTWTGQFGDLATTVDECRAELVGAYLMDDVELLKLFGYDENSDVTASDLTYNTYMQLGTDGLRGLGNFNAEHGKWGQAHSRAHFAILKCLLTDGDGCVMVEHDPEAKSLIIRVDRSKIGPHGKPALGRMLLRLHIYRCTADVQACRQYYEELSCVDGEYLKWREIVHAKKAPNWVFVQANTFLQGEDVVIKEYEPTPKGVIQSWAERNI
ncbi:peptidase M49, dipeptidyl-peptidase III [Lentithecium fluviatile CBS 122367]|uniref:Peptidase M49, dipeptidyl-peptidase III n=1 Tax=Lentithecium fluviatile CBS 122367 TaxID=1168545 RepID=A0A6G1IKC8_9PLEO|nr:peptidase M49, dipeptidyl-peptidase III [Lentithecium fluviatile CBS 122367]